MFVEITKLVLKDKKMRQDQLKDQAGGGTVNVGKSSGGHKKKKCC